MKMIYDSYSGSDDDGYDDDYYHENASLLQADQSLTSNIITIRHIVTNHPHYHHHFR